MASSWVGSAASFVATALTDKTSCQNNVWIHGHWVVTIANGSWALVAGIKHKDVRPKKNWLSNEIPAQIGRWIIFTQFPLLMDQSKILRAQQSTRKNFKTCICPSISPLQPRDRVKDREGILSFQQNIKQQDEKWAYYDLPPRCYNSNIRSWATVRYTQNTPGVGICRLTLLLG